MSAMLKREQKLRQSPSCQRAISLPLSSRHEINRQVRLRVVREFNLPDAVADLLEVIFETNIFKCYIFYFAFLRLKNISTSEQIIILSLK